MRQWTIGNLEAMAEMKRVNSGYYVRSDVEAEARRNAIKRLVGISEEENGQIKVSILCKICKIFKSEKIRGNLIEIYTKAKMIATVLMAVAYISIKRDMEVFEALKELA